MGRLSPPDPRSILPSRAHPEHRSRRKELEKEHPFSWTGPLVLGMIGVGLAWNIENQVQKHEERKDKEQREGKENEERRRRRREQQIRSGTFDPANQDSGSQSSSGGKSRRGRSAYAGGSERGSDRSVGRDTVDLERGRRSRRHDRDRGQSVDMGHRSDPRYIEDDSYYEQSRYDRSSNNDYDDLRGHDRDDYYRSRRDSW
ncbi:hypothetical protein M426DRAFT_21167 [Hypoxylon sp. CI-4A]|nr:hypothetical protein M426DRAFT_21167 [Hypoxylon sp. CI-4A]